MLNSAAFPAQFFTVAILDFLNLMEIRFSLFYTFQVIDTVFKNKL